MSKIITIPFGYLLGFLYRFTNNYGLALILFAILVKIILMPITAKSKKSSMKMSRMSPRLQEIQNKYANDKQKQSEAIQALYKEEGVSMTGGCLWSLIPLLILIPLFQVVRQPLVYMLHVSAEDTATIINIIKEAAPSYFGGNAYYDEMIAARHIPEFVEAIKEAVPTISQHALNGINFDFLRINLGIIPSFSGFVFDWAHIGSFLIPVLSAGSQVFSLFMMNKVNNSLITNEKGLQDKDTAQKSQVAQTNKVMMWMMPIMSLWFGFTVPVALSLYWLVQGLITTAADVYLTKKYRKIYDAEDAERLKKAMELEAIEAEKERQRAARRAANPDGITENTSKKKLQKQMQHAEEAAKAAAAREYAAKKGIPEDSEDSKPAAMSGIPSRPYCKGRNYDPNRYGRHTTEE